MPYVENTNLIDLDASYSHTSGLQLSNGQNIPDTRLDSYSGEIRYAHYFSVLGHPLGVAIAQPFTYAANWEVNGSNADSAPGMRKAGCR